MGDSNYVLVGGQNGTWFETGQTPRLERLDLDNYSVTHLTPVPGGGTVWGGGWNGSQWLISGWGEDDGANGSDPYIYLYDGRSQVLGGSLDQYEAESSWRGGDIFAASYNGKEWLLSGLGSGILPPLTNQPNNHMSLSTFDGRDFTDLSDSVPRQRDAVLYTNAWNGQYWLVGGGYDTDGVLFSSDGVNMVDLTAQIAQAVPSFGSVQSIAWNGYYWLIGGVNFLAAYDGYAFADLTNKLDAALTQSGACCTSVNAIAWDGAEWMLGGGTPVAQTDYGQAWLVTYSSTTFVDLTPEIKQLATDSVPNSSILAVAAAPNSWVIGGYSKNQGFLYEYSGKSFTNLSGLVGNFTYVNWVGAERVQNNVQRSPNAHNRAFPESRTIMSQYIDLTFPSMFSVSTTVANSLCRLAKFTS